MQNSKMMLIAGAALSATTFSAIAETPAYQNELRADAAARASLLQTGANAGHNSNGFYIGSGDGNFNLYVGGYTQFTYTLNFRDNADDALGGESEDLTNGFDAKRTRLIFQGNILNPNLSFYIEGGFDGAGDSESSNNGNFNLLEAWGNYNFDNGWGVKFGQFRVPLTRENMVDARHQLAADRSVTDSVFAADRTQGVAVHYRGDNLGFVASINDGAANRSTPFWTAAGAGGLATEADIAITARLEYMFAGDWGRFEDFTSFRNSDDIAVLLGGSVHWQQGGETAAFAGGAEVAMTDYDLFTYSIDLSVEGNGWNAFGAFTGVTVDASGASDVDNYGWLIQGGFFVADQLEIFGRWDSVYADNTFDPADEDFNTLTVGANYYFVPESHAAKFTFDVQYFLDDPSESAPVAATAPSSMTALVPDTEDGQFALRAQMQLVF